MHRLSNSVRIFGSRNKHPECSLHQVNAHSKIRNPRRPLVARIGHQEQLEPRVLLAGDLIGQWIANDLEGADGDTVAAWSDKVASISGTSTGEPKLSLNAIGGRNAVRFNATDGNDIVRIDNTDSPVSGADEFTVAVVFATSAVPAAGEGDWYEHMGIVDSSTKGLTADWGMSLNSDGQIVAGLGGGFLNPSSSISSAEAGLNDGEPHVAIFSRIGSTIAIYVDNGAPAVRNDASSATRAATVDLTIGGIQTSGDGFTGDIAEVRFYSEAADDAEAAAIHADIFSYYNNAPPQAINDTYELAEDPSIFFSVSAANGVLSNDVDGEGDPITATLVESTQNGSISLQPDGSFIYRPNKDFFGVDTFTYTADDFRPGTQATVTINVTPVYDPAKPIADSYKTLPNRLFTVGANDGVLANDLNPDQANLTVVLEAAPQNGNLTLNANGSFEYDPQQFAGATTFSYRINDGTSTSNPQVVTIVVNTPPTASDDTFQVNEDTVLTVPSNQGVAKNDNDAENDNVSATLIDAPIHGTIEFNADGSFIFLPVENYFGVDSFTYQLSDGVDTSNIATAQINISSVNDSPVAISDVYFGLPEQGLTISSGVLVNDSDVDTTSLQVVLVSGPSDGTLTLNPDGSFNYVPNQGFIGMDSFTYKASDSNTESDAVEATLFIGTSPVGISEILTANATSIETRTRESADDNFSGESNREDWIEIQNLTSSELDISGFHLTDDPNVPRKWEFPEGTVLSADGRMTVFASRLNITDPALDELGFLHTNFTLRVEGEYLAITSPDGFLLDGFDNYPLQTPDISFGRSGESDGYFVSATPGETNSALYGGVVDFPLVDVQRGFFSEPFQVTISNSDPDSVIRYTTNGSSPTADTGEIYTGPISIATTTNLRAIAVRDGFVPSRVATHTYLFLDDVIQQGNSPEGYPDMFGLGPPDNAPWEARPADYEMDPEITQNPAYRDLMDDALLAIPSISITTSIFNLFDTETGIYQNTDNHGVEWERPASIEMINPDGSTAFQIDAGIRMQGGASREPWKNPKHGFRLKFKGIYGADDLRYDWFGGDSVAQFDEIVLRAGANQAWTHHNNFLGDNRGRAQYIRDQWVNDTYLAMGNPAPHNDYAHLYVNGMYWGLYNPKERPTANFMASYFGGDENDYDVLNAGEVLDGTRDGWAELTSRDFRNLEEDTLYQTFSELIDIDAFIDYMVMNHYGANQDWDSHNWYAAQHRGEGGKFYFIPWDGEFVFISPNDNKIRSREAAPGQIFQQLQTNDEFKVRLADRIQMHLFNDGLLTPDKVVERWEARSSQITDAIIGESARWGDYRRDVDRQGIAGPFELLERDVQWMAERERLLTEYFPVRTDITVEQYRQLGLFPETAAALFNVRGGPIASTDSIELTAEAGTIYYTTDGSDPRLPGGALNPNAVEYSGAFKLDSPTLVRTRVLNDTEWSTIDQVFFSVDVDPADSTNLRISEINYNPGEPNDSEVAAGFNDNDDFEFIELVNISNRRVDLNGVKFVQTEADGNTQGIDFTFSEDSTLEPGQRLVVVEDEDAFAIRYGDQAIVAGQWTGRLGNNAELLTLMSGDKVVQQFSYADEWFPETDGDGFTLESIDPSSNDLTAWSKKEGWRASNLSGGSPGTNAIRLIGDVNNDGRFDSTDLVVVFTAAEYEDSTVGNSTFEEGDWNGDGDFTSADLVAAFQAGTYLATVRDVDVASSLFVAEDDERKIKTNHTDELFTEDDNSWWQ